MNEIMIIIDSWQSGEIKKLISLIVFDSPGEVVKWLFYTLQQTMWPFVQSGRTKMVNPPTYKPQPHTKRERKKRKNQSLLYF